MRAVRWILGVLATLALTVTVASIAYNALTSDPNVPVQALWNGRFEGNTAYRQWGTQGQTIVLLGGFLEPSFVWEDVGPLLARHARVYALDLDGFGYSVRRGPWTLARWTSQVTRFIRVLHLGTPVVAGHSLGAAVAVELARRGVASRAVLVDGDAVRGGGPPHWLRAMLARLPFLTTAFRLVPHWDWAVRRVLANAYGPERPPLDAAELARWTDQFRAKGARRAFRGILEAGIPGFTRTELRQLDVHATVVWGARDGVDPVSAGRQTARDLHARFVEISGAGHLSMLETAPRIAGAIASGR